ncbi:hypothetical protein HAL013_09760 [Helicobacter ailurogastricus]|uniref:Uncharacterized protein n=1 Tax=Helicobacter ailurogastricus TaxID=1578720 RepID=A0A0K2XDG8_9HELI|nr:hypothetical protein HAL011_13860 [Helicobacter ailurogastricus]CRF42769.1 hypothetical protein HAL013_09760 [Helicobacter ailurogastricus]CRF43889.1 hypothetical protein HAL09_04470 [Helicobacter ailurogastricus]
MGGLGRACRQETIGLATPLQRQVCLSLFVPKTGLNGGDV